MKTITLTCLNRTQDDNWAKIALIDWCERSGIVVYELKAADNFGRNKFTFESDDDNLNMRVLESYLLMHPRGTVEFTL